MVLKLAESYHEWIHNASNWPTADDVPIVCGNVSSARQCPSSFDIDGLSYNVVCMHVGPNPNFGYTNFDSFGAAVMTTFQVMTLDFWEDVYNNVLYSTGSASILFFIFVIFIGSFFVLNLVLAVVAVNYASSPQEQRTAQKAFFSWWPKPPSKPRQNPTRIQDLVDRDSFQAFIMVIIVANTIVMCMEYHGMSQTYEENLFIANVAFTGIFIVEMMLKMIADGILGYFGSSWNCFDFIIVVASVVEILLTIAIGNAVGGLSALRIMRLLRILRLAQGWKEMARLIETIAKSLVQVVNLVVILLLLMYMFAVVGMQLFRDYYIPANFPDGVVPRWNFVDFQHSFMMIFRILCGEWIEPLWDCMLATSSYSSIYFLTVVVVGNFIVLNLFLALVLSAFDTEDDSKEGIEDDNSEKVTGETDLNSLGSVAVMISAKGAVGTPTNQSTRFSRVQEALRYFIDHWVVQSVIFVVILWSSVMLCFEDYTLRSKPELKSLLYNFDVFFAIFFAIEFAIKIVALGVKGYFRIGWNWLDFLLVVIGIVSVAVSSEDAEALTALRTLRALRPLRAVSRWEGMRIIVDALCQSIPAFFNVFVISMIFWLIFALMGYGFFGGLFHKCVDRDGERIEYEYVADRTACCGSSSCTVRSDSADDTVYRWENSEVNFDNVFNAYLALYQVATFEGWQEVMQDAVDITGHNRQPREENQFYAYWFFFFFIVVGSFLTLNLFIGVIIDNFTRLKGQMSKDGSDSHLFLTDEQLVRIQGIKKVLRSRPMKSVPLPPNGMCYEFRLMCYRLSQSVTFELFIMAVIVANLVLLCTDHYGESDEEEKIQLIFNVIFSVVFVLEATINLIGLRRYYFKSNWNNFDLIITVLGAIDVILTLGTDESPPVDPTFLRILRLARLARLLKHAKGIRDLLITMIVSLPALFNVGLLLFMIIFVYAIIGMVLFRYVIYNGALNPIVNFETFGRSLQLMFRLCTAAGWNDITDALSVQPPYCNATYDGLPNGNCGDPVAAKWFMSTYVGIAFLIIVNMYIAVILESLEETTDEGADSINPQDIEVFYQHWQRFDPHATQFIDVSRIPEFFTSIPSPFE